jgi:hypothetical protein
MPIRDFSLMLKILEYVDKYPSKWGTKEELKNYLKNKLSKAESDIKEVIDFLTVNGFIKLGINKKLQTTWQKTQRLEKTLNRWKFLSKLKANLESN